jgi:hypothetical protein
MNTCHRLLFAVGIAIVGWLLREFWQRKADSEDNECSCYDDVTPRDEFDAFLANDKIFDAQLSYFRITLSF